MKDAPDVVVPGGAQGCAARAAGDEAIQVLVEVVFATRTAVMRLVRGAGGRRGRCLRNREAHGQVGGEDIVGDLEAGVAAGRDGYQVRRVGGGVYHRDLARREAADEVFNLYGVLEVHDFALRAARAVVDRQLLQEGTHAGSGT